jgi:nifR3 family TIM-barrel protein
MNFWKKQKSPIFVVAPMDGITDSAFRQVCLNHGADVAYTEMTAIDGLFYDSKNTITRLAKGKKEKPVVLQLFGKRPENAAKAMKYVEEAGFDGVDLNFGCPARKVVNHGGGVNLLRDLNLCHEIVQAVCEAATIPVSVKTRIGINKKNSNQQVSVLDFIDKIKDLPVTTLMLHGRTYEEGFSGPVHYDVMREAKRRFHGLVIGNGGLNAPEDVKKMLDETGVDGVALARGLYGKPWLFELCKDYLKIGEYKSYSMAKIKKVALEHAKLLLEMKGDHGIIEMRKHLTWYFRGFPNASDWRERLVHVETIEDIKTIFKQIAY